MKKRMALPLHILAVMAACGPPKPGDEADDSPSPIETQCDAFCERAIACDSEEFAQTWGFATQSECVDFCQSWTQAVVDVRMKPSCEAIMGAEWECASMIEECYVWRSYEDDAFGGPPIDGNPCRAEADQVADECST